MKQLKILIADDSIITTKKLTLIFQELGHNVICTAKNGKEAVEMFRQNKPDFVSMDITMPELDGIVATKEIISINDDAMILIITSHGQEQMVIEAIEAGAMGYVLKPFSKEKIEEQINIILGHAENGK